MKIRIIPLVLAMLLILSACGGSSPPAPTSPTPPPASPPPSPTLPTPTPPASTSPAPAPTPPAPSDPTPEPTAQIPDGLEYEYSDELGGIVITRYRGDATELEIPAQIDNEPVVAIGRNAFASANSLASVEIPSSVMHVGEGAFTNTAWFSAQPDGVVYMGNVLLVDKGRQSTHIAIREGTRLIADHAFRYSPLGSVEIPNSVTRIGVMAFSQTMLTSIEIPGSVTHIDEQAFAYNRITSLTFGNGITHIGLSAFKSNDALTSVVIPDSVTHIGRDAFVQCSSLASIVLGNGVTHIGHQAFSSTALASVVIPDSVMVMAETAFMSRVSVSISEETRARILANSPYYFD